MTEPREAINAVIEWSEGKGALTLQDVVFDREVVEMAKQLQAISDLITPEVREAAKRFGRHQTLEQQNADERTVRDFALAVIERMQNG